MISVGQDQSFHFPVTISIVLYENSLVDNRLSYYLKQDADPLFFDEEGKIYMVTTDDVLNVLNTHFLNEINNFNSYDSTILHKYVNSIYFLSNIVNLMSNLRFIKVTISSKQNWSRKDNNSDIIKFDYTVLDALINLPEFTDEKSFNQIVDLIGELGYIDDQRFKRNTYININAAELVSQLEACVEDGEFYENYEDGIVLIQGIISQKFQLDKTNLSIVIKR